MTTAGDASYVEVSIPWRDVHLAQVAVSARVGPYSGEGSAYFGVEFGTGVCTALVDFADSLDSYPMPPQGSVPLRAPSTAETDSPMAIDLQAFGIGDKGGVFLNIALRASTAKPPRQDTDAAVQMGFPTDIAGLERWAHDLRRVATSGKGVARIESC